MGIKTETMNYIDSPELTYEQLETSNEYLREKVKELEAEIRMKQFVIDGLRMEAETRVKKIKEAV